MNKVCLKVDPGICGFVCEITAEKIDRRTVRLEINGSKCGQIKKLAAQLKPMTVSDLFVPVTRNPLFKAAERCGCHLSCPIPTALVKASEIALELALPKNVMITYTECEKT